ncbi:MAG: hypothetical protein WCL33_03360 [Planctomycetota bacterium]|nr:hypothetical protein [Planctomycetota bacterium]
MSFIDFHELKYTLRNRGKELFRAAAILAMLLIVSCGVWWWVSIRWRPPPSIFDTPVDDVLGYLALDDFNELSLEERMRFLLDLSNRFRGMESSDSAAMAGFFAGVTGPARKQMTQNVRILARDILVQGASGYFDAAPSDQGKYIDDWVVNWTKMGEKITTGKESDETDKERIDKIKSQSDRTEARMKEREVPSLTEDGALGFMSIWQKEVEVTASPKQQGQISRFLQDVRKRYSNAF